MTLNADGVPNWLLALGNRAFPNPCEPKLVPGLCVNPLPVVAADGVPLVLANAPTIILKKSELACLLACSFCANKRADSVLPGAAPKACLKANSVPAAGKF